MHLLKKGYALAYKAQFLNNKIHEGKYTYNGRMAYEK